ncbi:DUF4150 domain-containing protein [Myxococcus sp. CA051A]|uniref:DUF4150 domain-containing protein n=1 Tax=Myxococcus sp. CA051A TaxID=2741739 RepID=UPI00157B22EB|nr:DUF4150 domain-containing protein [Myxococcus sp. CA051A]NTX60145.1 DUF4150 domain-containing protein [Myxococcus sp. CA051A]
MGRVYANGRSILHKGDGNTHTSAAPDVCKVPTPGGPVPTPFVNSAQDSMLTKGSTSVTIEGHPVALTSSELSTSSGDEPGTAGGLISSKFKGKMAWGSGSMDVKVEGKGVVRYLDVTLHNGNTYNTTFISDGRTAWAYGDDSQCTACGKSTESHRVHETGEAVANIELVFTELIRRLHEQRPLIEKYLRLREGRKAAEQKSLQEARDASKMLAPQIKKKEELLLQLKSPAGNDIPAIKNNLILVQNDLKVAEKALKEKRAEDLKLTQAVQQEMHETNDQLKKMKPVLRHDEKFNTFVEGYMVGSCLCKCPQNPRMLTSCSGQASTGFREAVAATPFELVEGFQTSEHQIGEMKRLGRDKWECAAPKLLQAGGSNGHKLRAMSERYFSPFLPLTVSVEYSRTDEQATRQVKGEFGHGESVPSCDACQKLTPEMLCHNHKECA